RGLELPQVVGRLALFVERLGPSLIGLSNHQRETQSESDHLSKGSTTPSRDVAAAGFFFCEEPAFFARVGGGSTTFSTAATGRSTDIELLRASDTDRSILCRPSSSSFSISEAPSFLSSFISIGVTPSTTPVSVRVTRAPFGVLCTSSTICSGGFGAASTTGGG